MPKLAFQFHHGAPLERLIKIPTGEDPNSRTILAFIRNKLSYHYDKKAFQEGIRLLLTTKEDNPSSYVLLLDQEAPRRGFFFPLADDLRTHNLRQYRDDQSGLSEFSVIMEVHHLFRVFMKNTLAIYAREKGINFGLE